MQSILWSITPYKQGIYFIPTVGPFRTLPGSTVSSILEELFHRHANPTDQLNRVTVLFMTVIRQQSRPLGPYPASADERNPTNRNRNRGRPTQTRKTRTNTPTIIVHSQREPSQFKPELSSSTIIYYFFTRASAGACNSLNNAHTSKEPLVIVVDEPKIFQQANWRSFGNYNEMRPDCLIFFFIFLLEASLALTAFILSLRVLAHTEDQQTILCSGHQ